MAEKMKVVGFVTPEEVWAKLDANPYTHNIGTPPYNIWIHDIVKGVVFGALGYAKAKYLYGAKLDAKGGALAGAIEGLTGGLEDIMDAAVFEAKLTKEEREAIYAHNLAHEVFQSGLVNMLVAGGTSALLSLIMK